MDDYDNITIKNAVLTWDGYPAPKVEERDGKRVMTYPNARRPGLAQGRLDRWQSAIHRRQRHSRRFG